MLKDIFYIKKNTTLNHIVIYLFLILNAFYITISAHSDDHMNEHLLSIFIEESPKIKIKSIQQDNLIVGSFAGKINKDTLNSFSNFSINCEILGRAYKGRGFSCGFAEVEDIKAYCNLTSPNKDKALMVYIECNTTAGFNGDAICKGKSKILQGYGNLAGIIGFGNVEMPLAKTLSLDDISLPMKMNLKIKYPLSLKKTSSLDKNSLKTK